MASDGELSKPEANGKYEAGAPQKSRRPWLRRLLLAVSLIWGLMWLGPAIYLLYLNFSNHIVGPSIACPSCKVDPVQKENQARQITLESRDHDVLGAFQIVSKALEIWFVFVAASLVYNVCMLVARSWRGLPLAYMTSYIEFSDLRYILTHDFWRVPYPSKEEDGSRKSLAFGLYLLAVFMAILSVLVNLMGPATAVLLIPTLQWKTINSTQLGVFDSTALESGPQGTIFESNCSSAELSAGNYSCGLARYGKLLDLQVGAATASEFEFEQLGALLPNSVQIDSVSAVVNSSLIHATNWAPNFKVVGQLSKAFVSWDLETAGPTAKNFSDNFLQTQFIQAGPAISFTSGCSPGNMSTINLPDGRQLRCLTAWSWDELEGHGTYKAAGCYGVGSNWNMRNENATFSIAVADLPGEEIVADIITIEKEILFNLTDPICNISQSTGLIEANSCPWDRLFNSSKYVFPNRRLTFFHSTNAASGNKSVGCSSGAGFGFSQYILDATAPLNLVSMTNILPKQPIPAFDHPDWYLAAWSVDRNGTVDGRRAAARAFASSVLALTGDSPTAAQVRMFQVQFLFSLGLSRSMVDFNLTDSVAADTDRHPLLTSSQQIYVYAYGNDSRTLKLGYVVVIFGSAIVIFRTVLVLIVNIPELSAVGMMITAIKYKKTTEFDDDSQSESKLAKLRYRLIVDGDGEPELERVTEGHVRRRRQHSISSE